MPKTVQEVAKALKLKAQARPNVLSVRIGTRKFTLPFEARLLSSDRYLFVHIPPSAEIMRVAGGNLEPVRSFDEARDAVTSFRQSRKRGGRASGADRRPSLPPAVQEALKAIPSGYRLAVDANGQARLVKKRTRTRKAAAS